MIRLENVSKRYQTHDGPCVILDKVNALFPDGRRIGILGANGSGKSTLIRLLSGVEAPTAGRIRRSGRISFPLGFGGTFHGKLSGHENLTFLARLYGASEQAVIRFADEFAELGFYMKMPVETYSAGMRAKLAFAACLAIDFDIILIDEVIAVGDARFQQRCRAAFEARTKTADIIMVSHNLPTLRSYCNVGAILSGGQLTFFDDLDMAIEKHAEMMRLSFPNRAAAP